MAARLRIVAQGFPVPRWESDGFPFPFGPPTDTISPLGVSPQSTERADPASAAWVVPLTGADSYFSENFSIARTPQALAIVVFHAPRYCLPMAPFTIRGMSGSHPFMRRKVRTPFTAFTSHETISHQR